MAVFHYLHLRAFAHGTEDPEKVRQALRTVAAGGHLDLAEVNLEGSHGNRIVLMEAQVKSAAAERALIAGLGRDDPGSLQRLREELPRRLDENLNFHLRLDKQEAFLGRLRLTTSDDAVTVRAKLRAFKQKGGDVAAEAVQALDALLTGTRRTP